MSKPFYQFFSPVKIIAGHKALEHVPFELAGLNCSRLMVVTDRGVVQAKLLEQLFAVFDDAQVSIAALYDNVPADSSLDTVCEATQIYRQQQCNGILAVGGGSVIDTAKVVNILASEGGDDPVVHSGAHRLKRPLKPLCVIPTTSGTGSEVTSVAVISDTKNGVKIPFLSDFLLPTMAVLDGRMTLTLPPAITAMTAMDALTHAVEAYTCIGANPLSDAYAVSAIDKISRHLLNVVANPDNLEGRLELAQAAAMAGIAFSNSMVGMVHALGHALGAVCHLPHGLCMSLFLPAVLRYNQDKPGNRTGDLLQPLLGEEVCMATPRQLRCERTIVAIEQLKEDLHKLCALPRTLKETGKVSRAQLAHIARLAADDGTVIFNPKEVDFDDMVAVLERAW